jgi:transposase
LNPDDLTLDSKIIGGLPIVNRFIERLGFEDLLEKFLPASSSQKISHARVITLLIRSVLLERNPLYRVSEWASIHEPTLLGLDAAPANCLNDDRVGRSLDALFEVDRASLMTQAVLRVVSEYKLDLSQLHNDSTSITFAGEYTNEPPPGIEGKKAAVIKHGHNKDHRPDLKQLVFSLSVSRDGAVPIHCKIYDGNTSDDSTHIETWEALRRLAGRSDFVYVADSKLCTREQMGHLANEGGRFITVLPATRSEDKWMREQVRTRPIDWSECLRRPSRTPGHENIYFGFESPLPSAEGFRIIWILSSQKQELDARIRQTRIKKTIHQLDRLKQKAGAGKLKTAEQITNAVQAVLRKFKTEELFAWSVTEKSLETYKQKGKGRPGPDTEYTKASNSILGFEALPNQERIQSEAATDGIFPLITNIAAMSVAEVLEKYKYQPYLEKRHEQLKNALDVAPVFLKDARRIEAFLFVYFLALVIASLVERELRLAMKNEGIESLPLYPEKRKCKFPTSQRVLEIFSSHRRSMLFSKHKKIETFFDKIDPLQKQILKLLNVSARYYTRD